MRFIWATRGQTWGFRFLRDGDCPDPLVVYDEIFDGVEPAPQVWRRVADKVALRFPDPQGRHDRAGRVIPQEFVVFSPWADDINSVEDGLQRVWPLVAAEFDEVWRRSTPPGDLG